MSASAGAAAQHRSVANIRGSSGTSLAAPHTPPRATATSTTTFGSPSSLRAEEDYVVLEVGSRYIRVGFAGDNAPRVQLQLPPEQQRRVGDHRSWAAGYEDDWTKREMGAAWGKDHELWRYDVREIDMGLVGDKLDRLFREAFSKHLLIDSKPRRVALVVPSSLPLPLLSTTLDLLFNQFQSPMVSLLSSAAMSTMAAGLRSALVVDLGWAETVVTSIYEYREVRCTKSVRAGRYLVSSLHKIIKGILQEKGAIPREQGADGDGSHVLSFGECEEICTRVVWCKPSHTTPVAEPETGLATVEEQDELEHETSSGTTRENETIQIPLRSTRPPTNLTIQFSQLAQACEDTYFEDREEGLCGFDDEELPIHWLVYKHLLQLPLDARATCMSRIVFTGGRSNIIGIKSRIFNELAALVRSRGWDPVMGRAPDAFKNNPKLNRIGSKRAAVADEDGSSPHSSMDVDDDAGQDGVWHDAANAEPETNAIDEQLERRKAKPLQGQLRAVETLGPWCGASLTCQLKTSAIANVERESWLQHGVNGASRPGEVDVKTQHRQSLGAGGLMRAGASGQDRAWTLGAWGMLS